MPERATIEAAPRTILGKKVKQLRREGIVPGNVYGKGLESVAVQMDLRTFLRTVRTAGVRSMFELKIEGEPAPRYVVLRDLAREGGTGQPTHVDFYQVDLQRPVTTNVGLRLVGEAPAVRDLAGTLRQITDVVTVRCLPLQIPDVLEANVSVMKSFERSLMVSDIEVPEGVEILAEPNAVIATVSPPRIARERAG